MKQAFTSPTTRNCLTPRASKRPSKSHSENALTPAKLTGVLIPSTKGLPDSDEFGFRLVCPGRLEYRIIAANKWKSVLSNYSWDEVRVIGLLNLADRTLIPQKVLPRGPRGAADNLINFEDWTDRNFVKKIAQILNDFVVLPVAVLAVLMSSR